MNKILMHYVVIETYEVPKKIAESGEQAIMNYIEEHKLEPDHTITRDWEIVDTNYF